LLALLQSPEQALYVILLYTVVQQFETYIVTPLVQERAVHLPPVLTVIAQIVLGVLFGILGLIVATPLMAVIMVLVKMLYVEDVLGDSVDVPMDEEMEIPRKEDSVSEPG
jgi:predicted PurR-regulated permease PerM